MNEEKHLLSILVDNEPGVLSRIAGLFSGRGYNIESLSVAETNDPKVSRVTMVTTGAVQIIEQIKKQLHKLINVITVHDLTGKAYVQRELVLIKVYTRPDTRGEILRIADVFRANIVDVGNEHYTVEVTGSEDKISAILKIFQPMGIKEIVRTGPIALFRE